ncbi:MAG: alpha/beta hydrolase [Bacteroidales bacterium]|nr:alpha/beta hydrolase [Bacteroidales bacterium]MCF8337534.1 alpha/beta hydrolase [Bacteroidales bacterium]
MKININDKKVSYNERGSGKTIVLLHGFLENKNIWYSMVGVLSQDFHVVTIDLPGHGESEVLDPVHDMGSMASVVKEILASLDVRECLLVGHSMGGYVSLAFAELFPHMVKGLVLFHSQAAADDEEGKRNRDRTVKVVEEDRAGFIRNFIPDLFAPGNDTRFKKEIESLKKEAEKTSREGIVAAVKGMKERTDKLDLLGKLENPILFISGKQDARIPVEKILDQVAIPAHSEAILLENTSHMGFIEAQEKTTSALRHFALRVL